MTGFEFSKNISKNTFSYRTPTVAASDIWKFLNLEIQATEEKLLIFIFRSKIVPNKTIEKVKFLLANVNE